MYPGSIRFNLAKTISNGLDYYPGATSLHSKKFGILFLESVETCLESGALVKKPWDFESYT